MKHQAEQFELDWGEPEAFALVQQKALDGDRIAREKQEKEDDLNQAEHKQGPLI